MESVRPFEEPAAGVAGVAAAALAAAEAEERIHHILAFHTYLEVVVVEEEMPPLPQMPVEAELAHSEGGLQGWLLGSADLLVLEEQVLEEVGRTGDIQ